MLEFDVGICQEAMQELRGLKGHNGVCGLEAPLNCLIHLCKAKKAEEGRHTG